MVAQKSGTPYARDRPEREKAIGVAPDNQAALTALRKKRREAGRHADRILIYGRSPRRDELGRAVTLSAEEKSAVDNFEKNYGEERAARRDHEAPVDQSPAAP